MAALIHSFTNNETPLKCLVCQQYLHDPRILQCGHQFCRKCLEKSSVEQEPGCISCPDCLFATFLPDRGLIDLPTHSLINKQQTKIVGFLHTGRGKHCDLCNKVATNRCTECKKNICDECEYDHIHPQLEGSISGVPEAGRMADHNIPYCVSHPTHDIEMHCLNCNKGVCSQCIMLSHTNHRFSHIAIGATKNKLEVQQEKVINSLDSVLKHTLNVSSNLQEMHQIRKDMSKPPSTILSDSADTFGNNSTETKSFEMSKCVTKSKEKINVAYETPPLSEEESRPSPAVSQVAPLGHLKKERTISVVGIICGLTFDQKEERVVVRTQDPMGPIKLYNYSGELVSSTGRRVEALSYPGCIALDTCRDLYIAPSEETLLLIDKSGALKGEVDMPDGSNLRGVSYSEGGDIYVVSDIGKHRLYLISADNHQVITRVGSRGSGPSQFYGPYHVHCACVPRYNHVIVVSDCNNHCLKLLDLKGNHLKTYGRHGRRDGQLQYPWGVTNDGSGRLVVTDSNRVTSYWQEKGLEQWRCLTLVGRERLGSRPECVAVDPSRGLLALCISNSVILFSSMP